MKGEGNTTLKHKTIAASPTRGRTFQAPIPELNLEGYTLLASDFNIGPFSERHAHFHLMKISDHAMRV